MAERGGSRLPDRAQGSLLDFEIDWRRALDGRERRWLGYPDPQGRDQLSLVEWVKGQQILDLLISRGFRAARVLEYGCGAAGMSIFLKERGYSTVASDALFSALSVARHNDALRRTTREALRLVAADVRALPFPDGSFDVAMSYGLLEHFDRAELVPLLSEVSRVIRPGGLFLADIVPRRLNARMVGDAVNLVGSLAARVARGQWRQARELPRAYLTPYYESSLGPDEWAAVLRRAGLVDVHVQVCRPFPMLALSGAAEAMYVRLLRWLLPLWRRFDTSSSGLARAWGWMYLAVATRPSGTGVTG